MTNTNTETKTIMKDEREKIVEQFRKELFPDLYKKYEEKYKSGQYSKEVFDMAVANIAKDGLFEQMIREGRYEKIIDAIKTMINEK